MTGRRKPRVCGCTNHKGTPKIQHKSHAAALAALLTPRYRDGLPHAIYKCPRRDGCYHIRTVR